MIGVRKSGLGTLCTILSLIDTRRDVNCLRDYKKKVNEIFSKFYRFFHANVLFISSSGRKRKEQIYLTSKFVVAN